MLPGNIKFGSHAWFSCREQEGISFQAKQLGIVAIVSLNVWKMHLFE